MKALLIQLLLPPVLVAFPWLLALVRGQWVRFALLLLLWSAAIAVMLLKWSVPGAVALVALGLITAMSTTIQIHD